MQYSIQSPCLVIRDNWSHVSDCQINQEKLGRDSSRVPDLVVPKYKSGVRTTGSEATKRFNPLRLYTRVLFLH
jgi:hypothetical protein